MTAFVVVLFAAFVMFGGLIVDDLDWRWIFFINVPVCLIGLVLAWLGMPDVRTPGRHRFDALGFALLSPGLAAIVYGFSVAGRQGDFTGVRVIVPLALGAALLVLFTVHALRTAVEPIIDLRLFRSRAFAGSSGMMFLFGISLFGAMFLLPLYEQQARGRSAAAAGLLLAPQGLGMMIALIVLGRVADRRSPRLFVLVGLLLSALGSVAYTQVAADTSEVLLGVSLTVRGIGLAMALIPVMSSAYHGLRREEIPRATSAGRIFQQIGGSLGTAILAVVLSHQITGRPAGTGPADPVALAGAFGTAFWWTLGSTVLAAPFAFLLPGRPAGAEQPAPSGPPVELPRPAGAVPTRRRSGDHGELKSHETSPGRRAAVSGAEGNRHDGREYRVPAPRGGRGGGQWRG